MPTGTVPFHVVAAALVLGCAVAGSSTARAAGPFQAFAGTWKGGGTVSLNGSQEAIRCKAVYTVAGDGNSLNIDVNCASDATRVNIVSNVVARGDSFSGSWEETTRGISGDVSGRIPEPNTFQASLQTMGGGLQLGARSNGKRQAITITSQGSEIQGASIALKRR